MDIYINICQCNNLVKICFITYSMQVWVLEMVINVLFNHYYHPVITQFPAGNFLVVAFIGVFII